MELLDYMLLTQVKPNLLTTRGAVGFCEMHFLHDFAVVVWMESRDLGAQGIPFSAQSSTLCNAWLPWPAPRCPHCLRNCWQPVATDHCPPQGGTNGCHQCGCLAPTSTIFPCSRLECFSPQPFAGIVNLPEVTTVPCTAAWKLGSCRRLWHSWRG